MKRCWYIVALASLLLGRGGISYSQDYARMGERTILGTARYVGMGGAMSAIGGDPSAAHDNMAGLGLYRRSEVLMSFGVGHTNPRTNVTIPQASLVFSLPVFSEDSKVKFHNFMFSYRRLQSYNRTVSGAGTNGASLGALIINADTQRDIPFRTDLYNNTHALRLVESGSVNEFDFGWAMNIADQWYVGMGFNVQSYSLSASADYEETFTGRQYTINSSSLLYTGTSFSMSAGLIYRPTGWMRLGFGIESPSVGALSIYSAGTLKAMTDSLRYSYAPDGLSRDRRFHMPLHTSASVAFQIGAYGLIALQYDFLHQHAEDPSHSLRAGFEVIPVLGLYINAGYAYESSFKRNTTPVAMDPTFTRQDTYFIRPQGSHYASFAIGYRGAYMMVQAAYQYRWQGINLYAHENSITPYNIHTDTHRVVLTIGWHQN